MGKVNFAYYFLVCMMMTLMSCSEDRLFENDDIEESNLIEYSVDFTNVQNKNEVEFQTIQDAFRECLAGNFGKFSKQGVIEECDKEVALACKDAQCKLIDISFKGEYTIETVRTSRGNKQLIYANTFSTSNSENYILQRLTWEQGRYNSGGGKEYRAEVIRTAFPVIVSKGEKYSFEVESNTTTLCFYYDQNGKLVKPCFTVRGEITIPSGVYYMHLSYRSKNAIDVSYAETFKMYQVVGKNINLPKSEKMLTIIDDDGNIKYYTDIFPIAKAKKAEISSAVIVGRVGRNSNYMTWDNIIDAYCNGMEILCHTYSHPLSTDEDYPYNLEWFEEDYRKARNTLIAHNISTNLLVYSGSSGQLDVCHEACKRASFDGGFLNANRITYENTDRYKIPRFRVGNNADYHYDITVLKGLVNKLYSSGGWMVWMIHTSSSAGWVPGTKEGSSAYMLGEVIYYARANGIKIVTAEYGFNRTFLENLK